MSGAPICPSPRPVTACEVVQPKEISDASLGGTGLLKVVRGLEFDATFDSANLRDVQFNDATGEFELFVASDCHGTPYQTRCVEITNPTHAPTCPKLTLPIKLLQWASMSSNTTWFYFIVRGAKPADALSFRIMNMNRQPGLYTQVCADTRTNYARSRF